MTFSCPSYPFTVRGTVASFIALCTLSLNCLDAPAQSGRRGADGPSARAAQTSPSANTDFLSDEQFQALSVDERRRLLRGAWLARIEPTGNPSVDRIQDYVDRVRQAVVYDGRLTVFDLKATRKEGTTNGVSLSGEVLLPDYAQGVVDTLGQLGFVATSESVRILPDGTLKSSGGTYGVVTRSGGATMRRSPRGRAEQVNEVPMGAGLRLLRQGKLSDLPPEVEDRGDNRRRRGADRGPGRGVRVPEHTGGPETWFLAQSTEGYVGYVPGVDIERTDSLPIPAAVLIYPTTVTLSADHPTSPGALLPIAAGTYLTADSRGAGYSLVAPRVSLPGDAKVRPLAKPPITEAELRVLLEPFLGKPYEWGGTSSDGIDCSGLTQFVYRALGVQLPRDAEEQAIVGKIIAWGDEAADKALPGDLIYFINSRGRVSHVAVSLGGGLIAHAHERSVKIEPVRQVTDRSGESLAARILFARRVVGE